MRSEQISAAQVQQALAEDIQRLAEEVAQAMNAARDGSIIADTEELVRQANAVFREQMYAKAIRLLQDQQEAFSPSARRVPEQGPPAVDASDGERSPERA